MTATLSLLRDGYFKVIKDTHFPDISTIRLSKRDIALPTRKEWKATVKGNKAVHEMTVVIHPGSAEESPSFTKHKCEVRCTCNSFQYFCANPLIALKAVAGRPKEIWKKKIPNRQRNENMVPMMCKHLVAFCEVLANAKEIVDWTRKLK